MITGSLVSFAGTQSEMQYGDMNCREHCLHTRCNAIWRQELQTDLLAHTLFLLAPELFNLILAHSIYKICIIEEPNTLEI